MLAHFESYFNYCCCNVVVVVVAVNRLLGCVTVCHVLQSGPKKSGRKLMAITLSNLIRFSNFFARRFLCNFAVQSLLKTPNTPCICYHITSWNINVRKQAINDILQGRVARGERIVKIG